MYAAALQETSGCDQAFPVFQATVRRSRSNEVRTRAEDGVAGCSLALGLRAEAAGKPEDAALWFAAAIRVDSVLPSAAALWWDTEMLGFGWEIPQPRLRRTAR